METAEVLESAAALELLSQIQTDLSTTTEIVDHSVPMFVAIDTVSIQKKSLELGISTFDPLCLRTPKHGEPDALGTRIITHCYAKGASRKRHNYKMYRFGTPQRFKDDDVSRILDTYLRPENTENQRKLISIGHNIRWDLDFLKANLKIDLSQRPNVQAIMDTQNIARSVLMFKQGPSLKRILQHFSLDYIGLHNAAHDSRYTLRALLMLFVKFRQQSVDDGGHQNEEVMNFIPLMEETARFHKIKEGIKWCMSTRVKTPSPPDIFQEIQEPEDEASGIIALLA